MMKSADLPLFGATPTELDFAAGPDGAIVTGCSEHCTEIVIPAEYAGMPVTRIGANAFQSHPYLLSVTLPASLRSIGDAAFMDCHALMTVKGGAGLQKVGPYAFYQCINLRQADFPSRPMAALTSFAGCYQLEAAAEHVRYR